MLKGKPLQGWKAVRQGQRSHELILDRETALESGLTFLSAMVAISSLTVLGFLFGPSGDGLGWKWKTTALAIFIFLLLARWLLDDHYVLDFERRVVQFSRSFVFVRWPRTVCSFDDLVGLAVDSKIIANENGRWCTYGISLVRTDGSTIDATTHTKRYDMVVLHGKVLAERMGLTFHPGQENSTMKVRTTPQGPTVEYLPDEVGGRKEKTGGQAGA